MVQKFGLKIKPSGQPDIAHQTDGHTIGSYFLYLDINPGVLGSQLAPGIT